MLNYKGLSKRPSYDGVVEYLEHHQEIIKYPNRIATENVRDNLFNGEYEQLKQMRRMRLMNMHNADQSTQTDFYKNIVIENYTQRNWRRVIGT